MSLSAPTKIGMAGFWMIVLSYPAGAALNLIGGSVWAGAVAFTGISMMIGSGIWIMSALGKAFVTRLISHSQRCK